MRTVRALVLLLLSFLMVACTLILIKDEDDFNITEPQVDFSAYQASMLKKLKNYGVKAFSYSDYYAKGFSTFTVSYQGHNDLSAAFSVLEDGYSIFCYFPTLLPQSLATEFDLTIIIDILDALDEHAISHQLLLEFFLAADSDYLPDDYQTIMFQPYPNAFGQQESVLSYKTLVVDSNYLELVVSDKGSSRLWLYSHKKLKKQDTFHYATSIADVLETYKCKNWSYQLYEAFFTQLTDGTEFRFSLTATAKKSLVFKPSDIAFILTYSKQLSNIEDSFERINIELLAELCAVLQPGLSLTSKLQDFLFDESGLYDYQGSLDYNFEPLKTRYKTLSINNKNINLFYELGSSLVEIFSIELTNE